ncbi:hypothetical protein [Nonomuraea sp. NPDC049129]|uniref:hypothetical protein n=1 Tax=Nonomuraea sp. NPDC049129 TaxID=3155272 RepID=UPI0033BFEC37
MFLSEEPMALSRLAQEFAAEVAQHDWSDAPYRADRAGHQNADDRPGRTAPQLTPEQTDVVRENVMWVAAQVLGFSDPNFPLYEFAEACGVSTITRSGRKDGGIEAGIRKRSDGSYQHPGVRE